MSTNLTTNLLKRFVPLESLKRQNLDALCRKTKISTLPEGSILVKEGETDHQLIYLVSGNVLLSNNGGETQLIKSNSAEANKPLSEALPRQYSISAATDVEYISLDADLLDVMLTWDQTGAYEVNDLEFQDDNSSNGDWMTTLLQNRAFQKIPAANIQAIFMSLQQINYEKAQAIVAEGGQWLDVRLPSEFDVSHEPNAINIPLYFIRLKLSTLDINVRYVVYCDTGRRSSAGAFVLNEKGYMASVLQDGIKNKTG